MSDSTIRLLPTTGHHGHSVKFSPFNPNLLAVATGQNFGLSGAGRLFLKDISVPGEGTVCHFDWQDALFDVCWSEESAVNILTASGDGTLHLWDTTKPQSPLIVYREHTKEASSIDWCQTRDQQVFASSSWDSTIKVWDPKKDKSLVTLSGHEGAVFQTVWSPHLPGCIASVSADGTLRIWNTQNGRASMTLRALEGEAITCDWCKYDQNFIASAGSDDIISVWDLRRPVHPIVRLQGHEYPVRRLKYSPFTESQIASVSYDFSTRLWDYKVQLTSLQVHKKHTEFVYGVDFSNHTQGLIADCAFDQTVGIYNVNQQPTPSPM